MTHCLMSLTIRFQPFQFDDADTVPSLLGKFLCSTIYIIFTMSTKFRFEAGCTKYFEIFQSHLFLV